LSRVRLADKSKLPASTLSYGEQRRVEIARARATRPKVGSSTKTAAGMNRRGKKRELMSEIRQAGRERV